jgi:hypothetical protein
LVLAGLIIYAIPIIDTVLAIIRRKLAGKSISDADDQHLHHMLKRSLGVKGAVLTLYAIGWALPFSASLSAGPRPRHLCLGPRFRGVHRCHCDQDCPSQTTGGARGPLRRSDRSAGPETPPSARIGAAPGEERSKPARHAASK